MNNKLSSTLDRRSERRNKAMPLVKIDFSHPETFFDVLKQMNIPEGAEFELEKSNDGSLHLKPTGYHTFEEQKAHLMGMAKFEIEQDDSEEWIKAIKEARTSSESVSLD